ncbi:MAG TPA: SMP-30/gluconolactonase/LRE family protein [Acidimicrobiales bacterium]|nr:SMP-30/gluconolactonase/LRE family protein [Acidimicrobiales bacterium]
MAERSLRTLSTGGCFFEGPRWRDGRWWVSDFYRQGVFTVTPDGTETQVAEVAAQPSGLGWLPDGTLLVVAMTDHQVLRVAGDGTTTVHAKIPGVRGLTNDMVVSATGHAYVGSFGFDLMAGEAPSPSPIWCVAPDGSVAIAAEDLHFPNGSVITPDGSTLIVGETVGGRYTAFTIGADGRLSDRRTWGEMPPAGSAGGVREARGSTVSPDGCALDAEGHIWAADALAGRVVRLAPGGTIVEQVPAPTGLGAYACMLGGDDGRTLLVCLAPDFFEHNRRAAREAVLATTTVAVPHAGLP